MKGKQPSQLYFILVLILLIVGFTDTIYLSLTHYWNYTDISYSSFCAISRALNCDTVAQSPYSIILGLPLAIWGMLAYILFGFVFFIAWKQAGKSLALWSLLLLLSLVYSIFSIYFGYISATKIHSYCIMCVLSYVVDFSLLYLCYKIYSQFYGQPFLYSIGISIKQLGSDKTFITFFLILLISGICLDIFFPRYWNYSATPHNTSIPHGLTLDGHPWIGAKKPALTIMEFADYQCFQCDKMHLYLRQLIERYPHKIRLVHYNYPLDHAVNPTVVPNPFHIGSGKLALLAIYASIKGKFWKTNDALYALARKKEAFNTHILAQDIGIPAGELAAALTNPKLKRLLSRDIWKGMKLRIMATPSFVINSKVYQGTIPPAVLETVMK